jgi:hypothetical protein
MTNPVVDKLKKACKRDLLANDHCFALVWILGTDGPYIVGGPSSSSSA